MRRLLNRRARTDAPADGGFTLVELLIGVAVLGVVMIGLSAVMIGSLSATADAQARLVETRDQQFAAAYFGTDVQAATEVRTWVTARCGSGTAVVELRGTTYDAETLANRVTVVSYVFTVVTADGERVGRLWRYQCEAAAEPPPSYPLEPESSTPVSRTLSRTAPTATCAPSCGSAFQSVTLRATHRTDGAVFALVGARRTST